MSTQTMLASNIDTLFAAARPRLLHRARMHGVVPDAVDDVAQETLLVQKGEIKGIEQGQRRSIEAVVKAHFPGLLDLARERVARVHGEQQLDDILLQLIAISTEAEAHRFLTSLPNEKA